MANEQQSVAQIAAAPGFPAIPVKVLSGGKKLPGWMSTFEAQAVRERNQLALAALSPLGQRVIAANSGHFPQMSEPQLLIDTVASLPDWGLRCKEQVNR